jgi:hypothetical protein
MNTVIISIIALSVILGGILIGIVYNFFMGDNQDRKNIEISIYNSNGYLVQKIEGPCTIRQEPFYSNRWTIENESTGETYTIRNPGTIITKESNK